MRYSYIRKKCIVSIPLLLQKTGKPKIIKLGIQEVRKRTKWSKHKENETENKEITVVINKMKVYININLGSINKTKS